MPIITKITFNAIRVLILIKDGRTFEAMKLEDIRDLIIIFIGLMASLIEIYNFSFYPQAADKKMAHGF